MAFGAPWSGAVRGANNAKLNKEQKVKDNVRLTYLMYVLGDSYLEMHRSEKRYGRFFEGAKITKPRQGFPGLGFNYRVWVIKA